jgi:hypothetical protein
MNVAHLHLLLVHIPIILVPFGAILLAYGMWRDVNGVYQRLALKIFILSALFAGGAFLAGDGAEELVEDRAGVVESTIEEHEEASEVAIWLTGILGILSLVAAIAGKQNHFLTEKGMLFILILSASSTFSLGFAGYQGGKIRHPEAYAMTVSAERHDDEQEH